MRGNDFVFLKGFLHDALKPSKLLDSCETAKAILRLSLQDKTLKWLLFKLKA